MAEDFNYNINDERNYIVLVPIKKDKLFVNSIVDLVPSDEEPIKIVFSKPNGSFRFYYLRLPENFKELLKKLDDLQEEILCNL